MSYQEQMSELWQELSALKYRMMTMYSKTVEGVPGAPHDEFLALFRQLEHADDMAYMLSSHYQNYLQFERSRQEQQNESKLQEIRKKAFAAGYRSRRHLDDNK